jgi:hypothetical protein
MKTKKKELSKLKINFIGIYLFLVLLLFVFIAIRSYLNQPEDKFIYFIITVFCSGGIGGVIYAVRGFYKTKIKGNFNYERWVWWYIFRPIIGAVTGVFVCFLILGGLLTIGNVSEVNYSKGLFFFAAISFLTGFAFTQVAGKIKETASTLFAKRGKGKDEE